MELRRRRFNFRKIFTILYIAAFLAYLIIGLQPAEAVDYDYDGSLVIPSIGLNTPVTTLELKDHKLNTPATIAGSYSRNDTKVFVIGHSSTVFKNLKYINDGDYIYYNGLEYRVDDIKTLLKSEVDMNQIVAPATQNTLVIMTCAGEMLTKTDATHRLIVTAVEV